MSLNIADNFSYRGRKPLDNRLVFDDILSMSSTADSELYTGLLAFNLENDNLYIYNENNTVDALTGKWRELNMSSESGSAEITEYEEDVEYRVNQLVYLGEKVCRVTSSYTSSNLGNLQDSFDEDIKQGKLIILNTDHVKILNPYAQGNYYEKETLVYLNDYILRVLQNFTSDTTQTSLEDSLDVDISSGNLLILNKEAIPGILPYKQGTFFNKDKLVFADGRIGRVLNDYVSDSTGSTVNESINIDIRSKNLREMAENYKFKLYKTSQDMNKTIDAINEIPVNTITFEPGEDILNMQLHEGIYGPLGTLSIIEEIDVNAGLIKARTVNSREMEFMPPAPDGFTYTILSGGSGYQVGDIVTTNIADLFVEVTMVNSGIITGVKSSREASAITSGVNCSIHAEGVYYLGSGYKWYSTDEIKLNAVGKVITYAQGIDLGQGNIVVSGNLLAVVKSDFTTDTTGTSLEDSFRIDSDPSTGNLITIEADIDVPECLGSCRSAETSELGAITGAIKGNWVLIQDCKPNFEGQAGIGLYNGSTWDIIPIPNGKFKFPEPPTSRKYFRSLIDGSTDGQWIEFDKVDGNTTPINVKVLSINSDSGYVPNSGEIIWDSSTKKMYVGDGSSTFGSLRPFYESNLTDNDISNALGFTPENSANKGQANGYASLGADGRVPEGQLPQALTNTYTKTEIDDKDIAVSTVLTTALNQEISNARAAEAAISADLTTHTSNTVIHVTQNEKDAWNAKVEDSDLDPFNTHKDDKIIHVTQADKDKWNGMQAAIFVNDVADLPQPSDTNKIQIGNIGYVRKSKPGDPALICDEYMWTGTQWELVDVNQVSLSLTWGNLQDKPASTVTALDNAVTVSHNHVNRLVLDKISQSNSGNFMYNGVEIGIRVVFFEDELMLPEVGETDTLYIIYKDSRVRNYPSISVYKDNAFQMLGRGIQESAPAVGDMNILQSEYYSVKKDSGFRISVTPNQYFAFLPVEILRQIEGAKNQTKDLVSFAEPKEFKYDKDLINIKTSNCYIKIKDKPTTIKTVSDQYYSYVEVDLSNYKDIDNIG